jgi:hypothetical protein
MEASAPHNAVINQICEGDFRMTFLVEVYAKPAKAE